VIAVSHDRHFIDRMAIRTFVYEGNGYIAHYPGGYTDWAETRKALAEEAALAAATAKAAAAAKSSENSGSSAGDSEAAAKPKKLKFTFKEQKEFETIDDDIAALEEKIADLDKQMSKCGSDYGKLNDLNRERDALVLQLDEKTERWVYLNDLAEQIEAQKNAK
jgi:ATP-binding cassette subfamily F protein uup